MKIEMENITNVRDLGGIKGADGKRIKPKRLIRSSALYNLSDKDLTVLLDDCNLKNIVDFRTPQEVKEKPEDQKITSKANYYFLQSFESIQKAVTRDESSLDELMKDSENLTVEMAIEIIEKFYDFMTTVPNLQKAYKKFFQILLECNDGATLWHCSLGKDRAGIAAVLVEYALGVTKEDIMADYLLTNKFLDQTVEFNQNNAFRVFYGAAESFLNSWFNAAEKHYGSVEGYMEKSLNVGEAEIAQLRDMYLE